MRRASTATTAVAVAAPLSTPRPAPARPDGIASPQRFDGSCSVPGRVRLEITLAGTCRVDLRNLHFREDGDNDVWIGRVGQRLGPEAPILRMGDNHRDGDGFTWLD